LKGKNVDEIDIIKLWMQHEGAGDEALVVFVREIESAERQACAKLAREFVWFDCEDCSPDQGNIFIARAIGERGMRSNV
jgi:hypothetical protein